VLEVLYHCAKFVWARISHAAGRPKTLSFFWLVVRHAFERQSLCTQFRHEGVGVQKRFWYRWIGEGGSCVHPCSTSDCGQLATPLNAEVQKTAKIGFLAAKGRQNKPIKMKFGM